jgi:hypothetical protein
MQKIELLFIKICFNNHLYQDHKNPNNKMDNYDVTAPTTEYPVLLDVMYDGKKYIFKSVEEMRTHIAFLERKKKITQRVIERHNNKLPYELYINDEVVDNTKNIVMLPTMPTMPPMPHPEDEPLRRTMSYKHGVTPENMTSPYEPTLKEIKRDDQKRMREEIWKKSLDKNKGE